MSDIIPIRRQALVLRSYFKTAEITWTPTSLIWVQSVTPTPISENYTLKLKYSYSKGVNVYVVEPKELKLAEGKERLPHVYSQKEQRLCLYYPSDENRDRRWCPDMYFAKTVVPWAVEWLEFYEYWLGTGIWLGGGIHPDGEREQYDFGKHE